MANEKRLIDANKLLRIGEKGRMTDVFPDWKELPTEVQDAVVKYAHHWKSIIERMKSVDAVEVVRCKDCKHCIHLSEKYKCDIGCKKLHTDNIYLDFWCRYGERKDNERKAD